MATPTSYQSVTSASNYDASAGPIYIRMDGVDDALSSATFAAGTIPGLTDCLIAVRRDGDGGTVLAANAVGKIFGYFEPNGSGLSAQGAGSPTVYVDGVQLAGGTAVTGGTVWAALTAGNWHVLEYRGLDLSAWTVFAVSSPTPYLLNGALGEIQLFASGQDANRDKARRRLAAKYGVTLP